MYAITDNTTDNLLSICFISFLFFDLNYKQKYPNKDGYVANISHFSWHSNSNIKIPFQSPHFTVFPNHDEICCNLLQRWKKNRKTKIIETKKIEVTILESSDYSIVTVYVMYSIVKHLRDWQFLNTFFSCWVNITETNGRNQHPNLCFGVTWTPTIHFLYYLLLFTT